MNHSDSLSQIMIDEENLCVFYDIPVERLSKMRTIEAFKEGAIEEFISASCKYQTIMVHVFSKHSSITRDEIQLAEKIQNDAQSLFENEYVKNIDFSSMRYTDEDLIAFMKEIYNNPLTMLIDVDLFLEGLKKEGQITQSQYEMVKTNYHGCFLKTQCEKASQILSDLDFWLLLLERHIEPKGQLIVQMQGLDRLYERGEFLEKILTGPFDVATVNLGDNNEALLIKKMG